MLSDTSIDSLQLLMVPCKRNPMVLLNLWQPQCGLRQIARWLLGVSRPIVAAASAAAAAATNAAVERVI
jgi:hypothetical protein